MAKPQKGKALLQSVVEGILMEPSPDGYAVRGSLKKTNPAALGGDSGVGDYRSGCGGRTSALKQTVLLAVSSDVSPVRGMSCSEALVQVSEPRLLLES